MKNLVKYSFPLILIVGTFICMTYILFNAPNTEGMVVTPETITYGNYTWTYYKFHMDKYLMSLNRSLDLNQFKNLLPTLPQLASTPNWYDILSVLKFGFNTLFIYLANWIIYTINWTITAPTKILLYPFFILCSILGVDTTNTDVLQFITTLWNLNIPLIPYL